MHSPVLLDALTGKEHRSVVVCQRDHSGHSQLARLADLPNYVDIVTSGGVGEAAIRDGLRSTIGSRPGPSEALADLFRDLTG